MAEIINLNRARKARDKTEAKTRAAANRVAHGRSLSERKAAEREKAADTARLDGHRLDLETPAAKPSKET